jgi:hypothetical protein
VGLASSARTRAAAATIRAPYRVASTAKAAAATLASTVDASFTAHRAPSCSSCIATETIPVAMTMLNEPGGRGSSAARRHMVTAGRTIA